ncbi:histidine phosphatase family protein [Falsihalocynthiibacter arcticus]|nr:histidine phosphatase family protein [Falsihalocynthiibacter arcticus]
MKRLWWVRHAPTHAKSMVGWSDIPADLSDQAAFARLSMTLPTQAPIISSTLQRAIGTAKMLSQTRPLLEPDPDLREIHFGDWENLTFDHANARDPDALKLFWDQPGENAAPAGESWNDLRQRVDAAADRLLARPEPDIIIVAHFGAILCQVQRALGVSTTEVFAQKIDNLSLSCLSFDEGWRATSINQIM